MSNIIGWYYHHTNNELIFKRDSPGQDADIRESDFATSMWMWDGQRPTAWRILVEALSLGVDIRRIKELAELWDCDDADAVKYAEYAGIKLNKDGNMKTASRRDFVNLHDCPMGFGSTYLEAMAGLCKELGFKGGKMWNTTFEDLLKQAA